MKKICILLIAISLSISVSFKTGETVAYYSDEETASNNSYEAGVLDFSLSTIDGNSVEVSPYLAPPWARVDVLSAGHLNLTYDVRTEDEQGTICPFLTIKDDLTNESQPLPDYISTEINFSEKNSWVFTVDINSDWREAENQICRLGLVFDGSQIGSSAGFADDERIEAVVFVDHSGAHLIISPDEDTVEILTREKTETAIPEINLVPLEEPATQLPVVEASDEVSDNTLIDQGVNNLGVDEAKNIDVQGMAVDEPTVEDVGLEADRDILEPSVAIENEAALINFSKKIIRLYEQ